METTKTQAGESSATDAIALAALATALRTRASASNHRLALAIAGSRSWTLSVAVAVLATNPGEQVVWLSDCEAPGRSLPVTRGDKLLGSELDTLIYNAHDGFDPDSFGAALGALRGGGLLLLLTPPLEQWPQLPDPQAARVAVHPYSADQVTGHFLRRFARALTRSNGVTLLSQTDPVPQSPPPPDAAIVAVVAIAEPDGDYRTPDQTQALETMIATAHGRARRPLVIISDRGRGKSSVLGITAARLLQDEQRQILVTAPRRSAVAPLFRHAARLLPNALVHTTCISHRGASMEFLPPDVLCRSSRKADLLLVDEAAGIPAPLLEHLLLAHPRIVFATTVHGYEGTGRGFEVRFRRTLDRLTPGWREMRMETPIRWALSDPLERLATDALLLNATPAPTSKVVDADRASCRFQRLARDALASDEATLSQLFGLLVLAHYQTHPMDLRHLLDGPNIRVYALFHDDQVAATALVAIEGGFEPPLTQEIFEGHRRPRGHLLPQTLCAHAGIQEAAALDYARVIRIAVHPAVQGRGLGRRLLEGIVEDAQGAGLDLVGSSFGATKDLLDFWEHCGLLPVHLGSNRNAASGAHAAVVLHPLSPAGDGLQRSALERLGKRLPTLLTEPLRDLEPEIAACLLRIAPQDDWTPTSMERRELESFAFALRTYEAVLPLLARLVATRLGEALRARAVDDAQRDALICKILQHRDWSETSRLLSLTGRAQAVRLLRTAVGKLMEG